MTGQTTTTDPARSSAPARRTRRQLLAGGTGALAAVLAAGTLARPAPAYADNGNPVILGQVNTEANPTFIDNTTSGVTTLGLTGDGGGAVCLNVDTDGGIGVLAHSGTGFGVSGSSGSGDGVEGLSSTGNGVHGIGGAIGVLGECPAGTGVAASGATALAMQGPAVFSRSGIVTVRAGQSSATQTGVALTSLSLVLATLQQDHTGVYVRSAVPNPAASSFTIHLAKAVTVSTNVAWFVVN
jgi:hypothetical protein